MNSLFKNKTRIAWVLLFLIMAFYFSSMLLFGTSTFGDALRGYEIISQMKNGGGFNKLVYPSISNLWNSTKRWDGVTPPEFIGARNFTYLATRAVPCITRCRFDRP